MKRTDFTAPSNKIVLGDNLEILRETEGKVRYKFKPGSHRIAVKVIDNESIEGLEVFTLTLNGKVERKE